ncbi:DUF2634 domain-containing protein [Faecalibaculum rodentium]|jgi:phage baseplate assembly protein W|uniref:contractile injection system sheath initiator n=1 Tax=Faecalibaculum rodentium TaxID=1702221 RepID=UPI0026F3AF73|nr:DUF2634 domain-containing protein [Faecalibaculum rodentium]
MGENMTLLIDPETRDLVFDAEGSFQKIYDEDTVVQNIRHALVTWKQEFFADPEHGTDYERIMGTNQNEIEIEEIKEILREAIFQEPNVSRIDTMTVTYDGRSISAEFSATLVNDEQISLEVTA